VLKGEPKIPKFLSGKERVKQSKSGGIFGVSGNNNKIQTY
jgi:hypothetical protein